MTKYAIAFLVFFAALAALLLYIGSGPELVISSATDRAFLNFGEIRLPWQWAIGLLTFAVLTIIALWSFLTWLWHLPTRMKSGMGMRRRNKALDAMEEALIAGAAGDQSRARKKAEKARTLIGSKDLGHMISAQCAELAGDSEAAIEQYTAMLDSERTLITGQRGLAQQLLSSGDLRGAAEQAQRAYNDNKNARWAFDVLFQAQVSDHQWPAARETLELGEKRKHIDKDAARRRRAVLMTAEADRLENAGEKETALELGVKAASESPEFSPAAALSARLLGHAGNTKKAANLLEKAWSKSPHPALSLAYRDLYPDDTPKARAKHIKSLMKSNADHRESIILGVEESLLAGDAVKAWSALAPLVNGENKPSARLCTLAAKAETMLSNPQDARIWMERAASAPAEPDWSDLDPEGDAFDYTDQDWRRLVFSFGEKGELIHPRYERGDARRAAIKAVSAVEEKVVDTAADAGEVPVKQPDDTGASVVKPDGDLAERLGKLLD